MQSTFCRQYYADFQHTQKKQKKNQQKNDGNEHLFSERQAAMFSGQRFQSLVSSAFAILIVLLSDASRSSPKLRFLPLKLQTKTHSNCIVKHAQCSTYQYMHCTMASSNNKTALYINLHSAFTYTL